MIRISVSCILFILLSISCSEDSIMIEEDPKNSIFGTYEGIETGNFSDLNGNTQSTTENKTVQVSPLSADSILVDNISAYCDSTLTWTAFVNETEHTFYSYRFRNDSLYIYYFNGSRGAGWTHEFNGIKN